MLFKPAVLPLQRNHGGCNSFCIFARCQWVFETARRPSYKIEVLVVGCFNGWFIGGFDSRFCSSLHLWLVRTGKDSVMLYKGVIPLTVTLQGRSGLFKIQDDWFVFGLTRTYKSSLFVSLWILWFAFLVWKGWIEWLCVQTQLIVTDYYSWVYVLFSGHLTSSDVAMTHCGIYVCLMLSHTGTLASVLFLCIQYRDTVGVRLGPSVTSALSISTDYTKPLCSALPLCWIICLWKRWFRILSFCADSRHLWDHNNTFKDATCCRVQTDGNCGKMPPPHSFEWNESVALRGCQHKSQKLNQPSSGKMLR